MIRKLEGFGFEIKRTSANVCGWVWVGGVWSRWMNLTSLAHALPGNGGVSGSALLLQQRRRMN